MALIQFIAVIMDIKSLSKQRVLAVSCVNVPDRWCLDDLADHGYEAVRNAALYCHCYLPEPLEHCRVKLQLIGDGLTSLRYGRSDELDPDYIAMGFLYSRPDGPYIKGLGYEMQVGLDALEMHWESLTVGAPPECLDALRFLQMMCRYLLEVSSGPDVCFER